MNKRQVIILWIIAIALGGGVASIKFGQKHASAATTARMPGQKLLDSLPVAEAAEIDIQGVGDVTKLAKKAGKWVVSQRDDYPANASTVTEFLDTLEELKVTQGIQAGPSLAPRFGLDESATSTEKRGVTVSIKDTRGKPLATVSIDRRAAAEAPTSPYGGAPNGRFIRNHDDSKAIYRVSESFAALSNDPKRWLAEGFIQIEKIKSIAITQPDKTDLAWKLARETEEAAFTLSGAAAGETLDTTATDPLKSLFSYSKFDDVIPAAKTAELTQPTGKRCATIETLEGFTYTLTFTPLKPAATPPPAPNPASPTPPASDNYVLTVAVAAELPKERRKAEGEKPEDAKAKDTAFTERLKTLSERLEKDKAFAERNFKVSKSTIEPLLKERAALLKKDAPAGTTPPAAGMTPPSVPSALSRPATAVTPPVTIPPQPAAGQ
ncbi:MAG: DUF4340 domain-containing protein [Verrucomicrobia bacterium]|nr:MAG: DUF4340 domain-containing protein [Verrucomicrobiota bacterium]